MVSQSAEGAWDHSAPKSGSMLSLDGRQRPPTAKTPPSYYDAVRSRHSLSQPVNKPQEEAKQEKILHAQQVKYNSLPRPLPQRYLQANGQQQQQPCPSWTAGTNGHAAWQSPSVRQEYDSPPKPANPVLLQGQQRNGHQMWREDPKVEGNAKMKDMVNPRSATLGPRPPPPLPRRRHTMVLPPPPSDEIQLHAERNRNSEQRGGLLRQCYPGPVRCIPPPGDPRYSKGGTVLSRPAFEPRPLPPTDVVLRTGPLGTYPEPDVQARLPPRHCEEVPPMTNGRQDSTPLPHGSTEFRKFPNKAPDVSQQIYVDTNTYMNGQPMGVDHLAIPYRIPQVSPKNPRSAFERPPSNNGRPEPIESSRSQQQMFARGQASPALSHCSSVARHSRGHPEQNNPMSSRYLNGQATQMTRASPLTTTGRFEAARPPYSQNDRNCNKEYSFENYQQRKVPDSSYLDRPQENVYANRTANGGYSNRSAESPFSNRPSDGPSSIPDGSYSNRSPESLYANRSATGPLPNRPLESPYAKRSPDVQNGHSEGPYSNRPLENHYANRTAEGTFPNRPLDGSFSKRPSESQNGSPEVSYSNRHTPRILQPVHAMKQGSSQYDHAGGKDSHYVNPQAPSMTNNGSHDPYTNLSPKSMDGLYSSANESLYENHQMAFASKRSSDPSGPNTSSDQFPVTQNGYHHQTNGLYENHCPSGFNDQRPNGRPPPPDVPIKHRTSEVLPEARGWSEQTNFAKDVVKPKPRMPCYPNGLQQLTAVPAYQCVINELTNLPAHHQSFQRVESSSAASPPPDSSMNESPRGFKMEARKKAQTSQKTQDGRSANMKIANSQPMRKSALSSSTASLCSEASSISSRRFHDPIWDRMNEEMQKRRDNGSVFSASPWEREEKEKVAREQAACARHLRDREIARLEGAGPLNTRQEERLRVLRLEREFQRRAEQEDDDESLASDEEDGATPAQLEKPSEIKACSPAKEKKADRISESPPKSRGTPSGVQELNPEFSFQPLENSPERFHERDPSPSDDVDWPSSDSPFEPSKPQQPVPAPRPSKTTSSGPPVAAKPTRATGLQDNNQLPKFIDNSLTQLDIASVDENFSQEGTVSPDTPQTDWLIEVNSFDSGTFSIDNSKEPPKQTQEAKTGDRIYENVKPAETRPNSLKLGTTDQNLTRRQSRKSNGLSTCDTDLLPTLYASSKVRSNPAKDIPDDLEDKSPEFRKIWTSRPEKLTFQDKIRKFSFQAGEDDLPRDRVKNSKAQREIENKFSLPHKTVES